MIAVIADDMSGAAEVAGVCLRHGLSVSFSMETADTASKNTGASVLIVATDTRAMRRSEAVQETRRIAGELETAMVRWIFKKTDSALRGHVSAELKAAMVALKRSKALFVPANPEAGRIISEGNYYIDRTPLSETDFSRDPDFPVKHSAVRRLPGFSGVHNGTMEHLDEGINIPDARLTEDLDRYAKWVKEDVLPAGSAAFFEACLKALGLSAGKTTPAPAKSFTGRGKASGKTLMVCGSTHKYSRAFIAKARQSPSFWVSEMPGELLKKDPDPACMLAWEDKILRLLHHGGITVLTAGQHTLHFKESSLLIREALAKIVRRVVLRKYVHHLLIEGGATAFAIAREMGAPSLVPVAELAKGVVQMSVRVPFPFYLTIKPGSYRWPESLTGFKNESS